MNAVQMMVLIWLFVGAEPAIAQELSEAWVQNWQSDLSFVKKTLPETHPNIFHSMSEGEFNGRLDMLSAQVPELSHQQIIVQLSAIVASIGDGHTRLTLPLVEGSDFFSGHSETPPPSSSSMLFNHLPIRLYLYSDGLFVQRIGAENAAYAGAKVFQIGQLPTAEALDVISRVVHRDNEFQLRQLAPTRLVIPEVLWALGISESQQEVTYVLETPDGKHHEVVLNPVAENQAVEWVSAADKSAKNPLYLLHRDSNFWIEDIAEEHALYWQFNEVYDTDEESIADFARRLTSYITRQGIQKLIIDLRFNMGGNNSLNRSLLHALIRAPELQEPGSLFVITGRGTFSAAMMFAIDLEKHTNAIFVGEPTGASLNHYGDSRKVKLPNSGITIRVSTLYWQYAGPKDSRLALKPHLPAELSSGDFRDGKDPALEVIFALSEEAPENASVDGSWASWVLGYKTVVHVGKSPEGLAAKIDFVDLEAIGLPLDAIKFEAAELSFDFANGGEAISFVGKQMGDTIIGKVTMQGQTYPWVALRQAGA